MELNEIELNTVLTALRNYQAEKIVSLENGEVLNDFEIDELCEKINVAEELTAEQRNFNIDTRPSCGHSACVQHWIETGQSICVLLWACQECGCTDVQETAWIYMNNAELTGEDGPQDDPFCPQCGHNDVEVERTATEPKPFNGKPDNLVQAP